jgi:preprotein translocase subunit Sss1
MKKLNPVLAINALIFGVFAVMIIFGIANANEEGGQFAILGGVGFLIQAAVNFVIGIITLLMKNPDGKYFLISALAITLIGFSLCGASFGLLNL